MTSLLLLICLAQASPGEVAAKIALAQAESPWFWSPPEEGLTELPYAFETRISRQGARVKGYRSLHLEHVAIDGYAHTKCLAEDGRRPCSPELAEALRRDSAKRTGFTPEEKARVDSLAAGRRARRASFWRDFPEKLRFEPLAPDRLRFSPVAPGGESLASAIRGTLRFHPATFEIIELEYELLRDVANPVVPLRRGMRFEITLEPQAGGRHLPVRIRLREKGITREAQYSHYRRFETGTVIRFGQ